MNWVAFISYIILTAFTPGPNNIMAMSNASKYGFRKSFRFNLGVLFGFLIVMSCCCAFSVLLYNYIPKIEPIMVIIGATYILWLAWIVWRDKPHDGKKKTMETNSILTGMILQFVNVKVILYGITAMSTFVLPNYRSAGALSAFIFLLALIGFVGTCCWSLFGAIFERVFQEHKKVLNFVMALLLVYCAISLIIK